MGLTQGDELQLLLAPGADPFRAVLRAGLHPDALPMRWAIVAGGIDPGSGPATGQPPAYFDQIGYTDLRNRLGDATPTGAVTAFTGSEEAAPASGMP